jgi:hypothetical protein
MAIQVASVDGTEQFGIVNGTVLPKEATLAMVLAYTIENIVNAAPGTLDTLNELAAAIGDDPNFAVTISDALALKAPLASPTFTGTVGGITKSMVGLGNVDNTPDTDKPVSTAQQTALDTKQIDLQFKDEGSNLGTGGTVDTIDVVGAGVILERNGNTVTLSVGQSTWTAGENLSGERVVYAFNDTTVKYADKDTLAHESLVVGVTTQSASVDDPIIVQTEGLMTFGSWSWTAGMPVFLDTSGQLTQTAPTAGFVLEIGVAIAATVINIDIGKSIELV